MSDVFNFYIYDDRSIQFTLAEPIMLEDKDVTQFRFRIPKSLNGFDMSDWEWWFIFVNPNGTKYTTLLELTDDEDEPDDYSVATYTVGYGFSGIVGTVRFSIEALNVSGEEIVNEWHTKTYSTAVIDTLQGLRAIIPEPDGQVSTGITEEVKQALLQIARKVAYIDEHGQTYYNALYDALYAITAVILTPKSISLTSIGATSQLSARTVPEGGTIAWSSSNTNVATVDQNGRVTAVAFGSATITATSGGKSGTCSVLVAEATLTEISAVYTPSGTVYESDSLDSLKSDLVVTAHWSNGTSSEVASADYTLSGTLTMGTSAVTVSYGGMTTTFEVTVVGLTGITATYTQSGTVYDTASLDDLKSDLVVTANYSDSTSETVTNYTLSGTLAEGTSTVTVTYGGKTTTFSVTVSVRIPTVYKQVQYLQSDGTQGIMTDVVPRDTRTVVTFEVLSIRAGKDNFITGVYNASNQRYYPCFVNSVGKLQFSNRNNTTLWTSDSAPVGKHTVDFNNASHQALYDGEVKATDSTFAITSQNNKIAIFARGRDSTDAYADTASIAKIYSLRFEDNTTGNVVGEFIPCYRKSDGVGGMYDLVTNTFYTDSINGNAFIIGPETWEDE